MHVPLPVCVYLPAASAGSLPLNARRMHVVCMSLPPHACRCPIRRAPEPTPDNPVRDWLRWQAVAAEPIVNFQGTSGSLANAGAPAAQRAGGIDAQSAELTIALRRFLDTDAAEDADVLIGLIADRRDAAKRFEAIATSALKGIAGPVITPAQLAARPLPAPIDMACHYSSHLMYTSACGEWTTGALKHSATLAKLCELTAGDATPIRTAIKRVCSAPAA